MIFFWIPNQVGNDTGRVGNDTGRVGNDKRDGGAVRFGN